MSGWVSASIQWCGRRLRAAYSRRAIDAGVYSEPMICSVSAAADISAVRRARNASRTVSLSRGSVSTRDRKTSAGTTTTSPDSATTRRQVGALAGDEADLAEEAAGAVAGDQLAVRSEHVDRSAEDDDPVVVVVGGGEQHLAGA